VPRNNELKSSGIKLNRYGKPLFAADLIQALTAKVGLKFSLIVKYGVQRIHHKDVLNQK